MHHVWNANGLVLLRHKEKNEASGLLGHKEFTSGGRDTLGTALWYGSWVISWCGNESYQTLASIDIFYLPITILCIMVFAEKS